MRSKYLSLVVGGVSALLLAFNPAQASTAYHMNGQGSLTIGNGGLPGCVPTVSCPAGGAHTMSWGELTVQGAGLLQDTAVAGTYGCKSESSTVGNVFSSSISGNTSNFVLTFNFQCTKDSGQTGPAVIDGFFTNNAADPRLASYPYAAAVPAQPGLFSFRGYFKAGLTHVLPSTINSGAPSACQGGFAPTGFNSTSITTAAFLGACTSAA